MAREKINEHLSHKTNVHLEFEKELLAREKINEHLFCERDYNNECTSQTLLNNSREKKQTERSAERLEIMMENSTGKS